MITTRFAPSPTGDLHVGNARTALLNHLYARKHKGRFLLRFEDTDLARSEAPHIQAIQEDLRWLGLGWAGDPLFQSKRTVQHDAALMQLSGQKRAYRCFCSESQLALERKLAASKGLPPRYSGRCRTLSASEAEAKAKQEMHVWRLAARADEGEVIVLDQLRGGICFSRTDLDDPVIKRSNGHFTFMLPNAMDDVADGISHVLRGDDHLTNSAYQVLLLQWLGCQPPVYLHHGLLLGVGGAKLSKRSGDTAIRRLREDGLIPMALIQSLIRLGHPNLPEDAGTMDRLADEFEPQRLSVAAVKWSDDELWRWHARLLHSLPSDQLADMLAPIFQDEDHERLSGFGDLIRDNVDRIEDARAFARLLDADLPPAGGAMQILKDAGAEFFGQASLAWRENQSNDWQSWTRRLKEITGRTGKQLFMPLRAALTGSLQGPEMRDVVKFLGDAGVDRRLSDVEKRIRA